MQAQSLRMRRFVARYVQYLEVFGYLFVGLVAAAVAVLWFVKVEDVSESAGTQPIKPHEYSVQTGRESVVLRVLVSDRTEVTVGQPLVEVCDDPAWVGRYRALRRAGEMVADLDFAGGNLSSEEEALRARLRGLMAQWEGAHGGAPVETLTAPRAGVVLVQKKVEGTVVPANREVVKILDFDDLRVSAELKGAGVTLARVGQPVRLEILTTYGNGEILRSDVDRPGAWQKGYAQFNSVAEGRILARLKEYFSGKTITLEEDTTFAVSGIAEVDLHGVLRLEDAPDETPGVEAEPFSRVEIVGRVLEGTHKASVRVRDLPGEVQDGIRQALMDRFDGRVTRVDGEAFRVQGIEDLSFVVQIDAEEGGAGFQDGAQTVAAEKTARTFKFVTKLEDPHPALKAKVRELALAGTPSYIKAKLKVVVGQRRIAMLLFRKN